jgi:D-glycero-D-manno-heptose 1,7-bisphosphate phosphatase
MKRPAIFFDRDNTLIVSDGYLGDPDKVVLIDGAADSVARARSLGFATVVVSNQSGVARGMFDEDAVRDVNKRMEEMLASANAGAIIDRHEYCPYLPDASIEKYRQDSDLRKPKPGMILQAADKLALDLSRSWVIGDAPRDVEAGKAAGCRTILFHSPDLPQSPAAAANLAAKPDCIVASLNEAIDFIEQQMGSDPQPPSPATQPTEIIHRPRPASESSRRNNSTTSSDTPRGGELAKLEQIADQILTEIKRRNDHLIFTDFSVSKLMAGIAQVIALGIALVSYLYRNEVETFLSIILFAIFMQTLTIALLIMGRQR